MVNQELLKRNLQNYLDSKVTAGGLYGLTISDESFVDGLVDIIKLSGQNKKFKIKKEKIDKYSFWI